MQLHDKVQLKKLSEIKKYKDNAKEHPEEHVKKIADSIEAFGFNQPIALDKDGYILAGHGRLEASKKLGIEEVPVIETQLDGQEAKAYRLADNKLNESDWDIDLVSEELKQLDGDMQELTGFDQDLAIEEPKAEDDEVPETPEEPEAEEGYIYKLGEHRLICGDATSEEDVEKLMDGEKADMVFTDPPYNLAFNGGTREEKFDTLINDDETEEDWGKFIEESMDTIKNLSLGNVYVCIDWRNYAKIFQEMNKRWHVYNCIVWSKNQLSMGRRYRFQHEFIVYADREGNEWMGGHSETDVWEVDKDAYKDYKHPTQKPVELIVCAFMNSSARGDIVLDLFGGSGSTLIAAEKTNRKCYMMELDPQYVDVIIERWEDYTGQEAELITS